MLLPAVLLAFVPVRRRPRWIAFIPLVALVLIGAQLLVEGYRWQMVPAYVVTAILLLVHRRAGQGGEASVTGRRRWYHGLPRIGLAALLTIALCIGGFCAWGYPMFELPRPSGSFAVGTTQFQLRDESRPETFAEQAGSKRELMLEVWYPAQAPAAGAVPLSLWGSDPRRLHAVARTLLQPPFVFDHLASIPTHSYPEAPVAGAGSYPVILFSHGIGQGFTAQNTVLMEELASHGYVVVSISHPYEASGIVYTDGRVVTLSIPHAKKVMAEWGADGVDDLYQQLDATEDVAQRKELVRKLIATSPTLDTSVRRWTADTAFVLDQLTKVNADNGLLRQRLDLDRVGVSGMSFGGATAGQFCLEDARCKAGVSLDGSIQGDLLDRPLIRPFMFLHAEEARASKSLYENATGPAWHLGVKGTKHFDFTDFPLVTPGYKALGFLGENSGPRIVQVTNAYVLAFFNAYLKDQPSPLLQSAVPEYPEIDFLSRNRAD